jgi:putative ATP-dependent endonuclease of OLD family
LTPARSFRDEDLTHFAFALPVEVAAVTGLASLVLLRSASDGGTVAATTAHAGLSAVQRADLERYLDVSRAELLFCTAAILVEGISEVDLVPAL